MHDGTFTFKGTSTRTGELLVNTNEEISPRNNRHSGLSKTTIAKAIEETLSNYEEGATRKIVCGILWNIPWAVLLFFVVGWMALSNPA